MADYSRWPEKPILATNLELDPLNPRLTEFSETPSLRDIVAELIEHEKVYDLAKSIVDNGYYPGEALYAINIKNTKKKVVIEGNRRLAALRLLLSPDLAPEKHLKKFRALSNETDIHSIKRVRTIIAPSRESVYPIMMARHTKTEIEPWDPIMKAKFYQNLIDSGTSVSQIAQKYGVVPSTVVDAIRDATMYKIACALEFDADTANIVQNPRKFPITTLNRIYKKPVTEIFLGFTFDANNEFRGNTTINEFTKGFKKIIIDITRKHERIKPKDVYSATDVAKYLQQFPPNDIPNTKRKGSFTIESFLKTKERTSTPSKKMATAKKVSATKSTKIFPAHLRCTLNDQRIRDIFKEIRSLNIKTQSNCFVVLLRSFLEMSLYHYLSRLGHIIKIRNIESGKREAKAKKTQKPPQKLPKDWSPTLRDMLHYITSNDECDIIPDPLLIKSLKSFLNDRNGLISIDSLHQFVHNKHFLPDETLARKFGNNLIALFEIILSEPSK